MGKVLATQIKGMSWTAKISLVFVCTLLVSVFMYQGWYQPRTTQAAVAALNTWVNLSQTAPAVASGTVAAGNIAPTAGSNRVLLVAVAVETSANTTANGMTMSVTVGGTSLTLLKNSFATASRSHAYVGYLLNTQIPTAASAVSVTYNSGATSTTVTGIDVKWATYSGVNQTTPFTSSNAVSAAAAANVTFGATINYVVGGQTFFVAQNGGTPATITNPTGFTSVAAATNTATSAQSTFVSQSTVATVAGSYASTTSVAFAGTTSTRAAIVVASLNPAVPTITSLTPPSITRPATGSAATTMAIIGTDFVSGATVAVTPTGAGVTAGAVSVQSATSISVPITVTSTATAQTYSVTVTSTGLTSSASTFTVTAPAAVPTITSVSPNSVVQGVATSVTITGTNLTGGTPNFSNASATVTSTSATQIIATVTGTTANIGTVSATTTGGTSGTLPFTVTAPVALPTITSVTPNSVVQGTATPVTIVGTNLTGATVAFSNATAGTPTVTATQITVTVTGTTANTGTVTVTTAGGSVQNAFTVTAAPVTGTTTGALTFPTITATSIGVQAAFTGDSNNTNTGVIRWGTVSGTYSNTATATKGAGFYSATISGLTTGTTYYFQATFTDADGVTGTNPVTGSAVATAPPNPLLHSSANLGTKYGTWGAAYTCTTCHNQSTTNIKRVAASITTPTGARAVLFDRITATTITQLGVLGNDQRANLNVSSNVCEACHHNTLYHQYSSVKATVTKTHFNRNDCTTCHAHAKGFAAAGCNGCHPATGGLATTPAVTNATGGAAGAHAKHTGAPYNMTCYTCHNGYTGNPMGNTQIEMSYQVNATNFSQFNPAATVAFGTFSGLTPLANGYTWVGKNGTVVAISANNNASCNVYCHGNWANSRTTADPSWKGAALACNSCHFDKTSAPAGAGDHQIHLGLTGTLALTCANCHPSSGYTVGHLSGSVNWALSGAAWFNANSKYNGALSGVKANLAPSSSYGSCATTSCHGQNSPVAWGTTLTASGQCVKCHGQRTVTPYTLTNYTAAYIAPGGAGTDTGGNSAATAARVGAHQTHLTATDGISDRVHCSECHTVITNVAAATHLTYTTATITFGNLAKGIVPGGTAPVHAPSVSRVNGLISCNNTYCHTGKWNSGTSTATMTPSWVNSGYVPATMSIAGCSNCHGFPPSTAVGHPAVTTIPTSFPVGNSCNCHGNISTTGTTYANIFGNKNLHINGIIDVDSGHSFPYQGATHLSAAGATTPATSPCASCHNVSAAGTYPVAVGTAPNCKACHTLGLVLSGTTTSCYDCHGSSTVTNGMPSGNVFPNVSGTHTKHVVSQGLACSVCHANGGTGSINHGSSNRIASNATLVHVSSATRQFHYTPPTTTTPPTNSRGTCSNVACHGGTAVWGGTLGCVDCHAAPINSPKAQALDATVTQRRAIVPEFKNTWSHKRSATVTGTVTNEDCVVCHMEGDPVSHKTVAGVHADGRINFRDPDTGLNIKGVTHNGTATAAGTYTSTTVDSAPVRFSRNLASTTIEPDIAAMQINLCLKCHDADGALSSTAWVTGGSALKPFATTITGHAAPFNSNGTGNVVNVAKSFVSTNAAYHPVVSKANNSYTQGTRMVAPWTITKTTGNNTQYGNLMTCWDCHAPAGATGVQTASVTAHGAIATLRAPIRAGGATAALNLCIVCHAATYATTSNNHGAGSAFGAGGSSMSNTSTFVNCYYCHGYNGAVGASVVAASTRPNRAEDVHGTNDRTAGTANSKWTSGAGPYAFIRNTLSDWRPVSAAGVTFTGTLTSSQCLGTSGTCNNNMSSRTYTPGGAY